MIYYIQCFTKNCWTDVHFMFTKLTVHNLTLFSKAFITLSVYPQNGDDGMMTHNVNGNILPHKNYFHIDIVYDVYRYYTYI